MSDDGTMMLLIKKINSKIMRKFLRKEKTEKPYWNEPSKICVVEIFSLLFRLFAKLYSNRSLLPLYDFLRIKYKRLK